MNTKGSTETLSFLIGILIFILIVVPIAIAVTHYCTAQTGMQRTLNLLVERTSDLEDGQSGNIVGLIDRGYILISFEKDQAQFGATSGLSSIRWTCKGVGGERFTQYWAINKPSRCGKRACLCACGESGKDIPLAGDWLNLAGPNVCSDATCVVYDEDKSPRFYGGINCEYGAFIAPQNPTLEINFERQGQTIGICEEPPCISRENNDARNVFKKFYEAYKECNDYEVNDCICSAVNGQALPSGHHILFRNDGAKTEMTLKDTDGPTRATAVIKDGLMANYNAGKDEAKLLTGININSLGYLFNPPFGNNNAFLKEGSQLLYRTKEGYVGFVEEGEGVKAIKEEKDYCRIKAGATAEPGEEGSACKMNVPESSFDAMKKQLFGKETIPTIITGTCRATCNENEYQIGRRGDYCKTLGCCTLNPDAKCIEAEGLCQASQCDLDDFQLPIESITCPDDKKYCCKNIIHPCARVHGVCKHPCGEGETQGGAETDCEGEDVCCISSISEPVPLGV